MRISNMTNSAFFGHNEGWSIAKSRLWIKTIPHNHWNIILHSSEIQQSQRRTKRA